MIKSGKHVCERCHQEYEWQARRLENGEGVKGSFEGFGNINIATADKVNGTYTIGVRHLNYYEILWTNFRWHWH